jgi:outer membrane receptor protein involved in Fe transport
VFKNAACASFARASVAAALGGAAILLWSSAALAADAATDDATEEEDDLELTEVQVTGTRIQLPNVDSANPVTSITSEEMSRLGIVNVADALTTLVPQNISTYMPTMTGDNQAGNGGAGMESLDRGSFFIGNTIANLRGLDPTFGTRTLTLIDGRRVNSTSNQADVVDLNIIPSNLLERMDVVTGGASATYGSGAMAGVVNLVLNRRLTGVNLDMDYGVNETGDGGSPHVSLSGGTPLFGGKGHILLGLEWQNQKAIRNCAAARDWCAESRFLLNNYTGFGQQNDESFTPLPGYDVDQNGNPLPAQFEMSNVRRSQFAPTGTLYFNNINVTSNYRFNEAGTDLEEYPLGFRGGTGANAMNGDGPLATWNTVMRPSNERKSVFTNFEYDFSSRTTGYVQARYARTDALNRNAYTTGNYCVRFNTQGQPRVPGGTVDQGATIWYGGPNGFGLFDYNTGAELSSADYPRNNLWSVGSFRAWLGWSGGAFDAPGGGGAPYFVLVSDDQLNDPGSPANQYGADLNTLPSFTFANATPVWRLAVFGNGGVPSAGNANVYWWLLGVTLTGNFDDPGGAAVLPTAGRDDYAFLNNLSQEAQAQMRNSFAVSGTYGNIIDRSTGLPMTGANTTVGGGASTGLDTLYGTDACNGYTAVRKVWNPQFSQYTHQVQEPWSTTAGIRGRFGGDWRWESYVQYGKTDSRSKQNNIATNLRLAMAIDAVIDDRPGSATYGQPVCRVTRDGVPVVDYQGRPLSDVEALQGLAADCQPLNVFGNTYADTMTYMPGYDGIASAAYNPAQLQQEAIDYAFVESVSSGWNDLATLDFSTSGTLWDGLGAGPMTGAFGATISQNRLVNEGTSVGASYYERADLSAAYSDRFGGKTRTTEGYTELNLPLISGMEGINLFSINLGGRYTSYYNKGGSGTTGDSSTQNVFNWKFQTIFEPFEWVRFRVTRSADQRAPGYRDLFIQQPGLPDQFAGANPWRTYNPLSDEARQERWGQIRAGNPDLKPETSNTLTLGVVLSPGGWAQGMRFTVDYFDIKVKDGITTPFVASTTATIQSCWQGSGNHDPTMEDPSASNGAINYDYFDASLGTYPCREIEFAPNPDGSVNLEDIVSYNSARPINSLPYRRRGMDLSLSYNFPLNRLFEGLPGSMSLSMRGTRALESSGTQVNSSFGNTAANCADRGGTYDAPNLTCYIPQDLVGSIRSNVFIPGVAATPKWSGNFSASYLMGDLTTTLSARYIGAAVIDATLCDPTQAAQGCPYYQDENGNLLGGSVDNNTLKPYFNFALNGSYNLKVGNMRQFQVFGSINNLFDKSPPFTGGGISGASAQYHDIMGRSYRFGVRMRF